MLASLELGGYNEFVVLPARHAPTQLLANSFYTPLDRQILYGLISTYTLHFLCENW